LVRYYLVGWALASAGAGCGGAEKAPLEDVVTIGPDGGPFRRRPPPVSTSNEGPGWVHDRFVGPEGPGGGVIQDGVYDLQFASTYVGAAFTVQPQLPTIRYRLTIEKDGTSFRELTETRSVADPEAVVTRELAGVMTAIEGNLRLRDQGDENFRAVRYSATPTSLTLFLPITLQLGGARASGTRVLTLNKVRTEQSPLSWIDDHYMGPELPKGGSLQDGVYDLRHASTYVGEVVSMGNQRPTMRYRFSVENTSMSYQKWTQLRLPTESEPAALQNSGGTLIVANGRLHMSNLDDVDIQRARYSATPNTLTLFVSTTVRSGTTRIPATQVLTLHKVQSTEPSLFEGEPESEASTLR
jgi:hypothetical protein